jgi:hypothetical protein
MRSPLRPTSKPMLLLPLPPPPQQQQQQQQQQERRWDPQGAVEKVLGAR